MALANYPWSILNLVFPSIRNENNMNLDDNQAAKYLSIVSSGFFYGSILGALLTKFTERFDPKKLWLSTLFLMIISNLFFLYEKMILMAVSRFIFGAIGTINIVVGYVWINQTALPHHRTRFLSLPLSFYALANMVTYFVSFLDEGGKHFWRTLVAVPSIIGVLLLILNLIFVRKINCIPFLIRSKGYNKTL